MTHVKGLINRKEINKWKSWWLLKMRVRLMDVCRTFAVWCKADTQALVPGEMTWFYFQTEHLMSSFIPFHFSKKHANLLKKHLNKFQFCFKIVYPLECCGLDRHQNISASFTLTLKSANESELWIDFQNHLLVCIIKLTEVLVSLTISESVDAAQTIQIVSHCQCL